MLKIGAGPTGAPPAITGSVPSLLAVRAEEFSADAGMMKVALVALGKISHVPSLRCYCVDGYRSIGGNSVLPLGLCLSGCLSVVVVVVVVVIVVVGFPFVLIPTGFNFRDHQSLPNRLISHADSDALHAFVCQRVKGRDRVLDLGSQAPYVPFDLLSEGSDHRRA